MPISVLPNAGLPERRRRHDALRPRRPSSSPSTTRRFVAGARRRHRRRLLRHHAGAPRQRRRGGARPRAGRAARPSYEPASPSIYSPVALEQDAQLPDHRRAHQRQRLQGVPRGDARGRLGHVRRRWPREQIREGAHVLDVCVDYVGRDGTADMDEIARRFATQASVPLVLDSHRAAGDGGRPAAHRRPGHPQLGQPRGRRAARQPLRPGLDAGREYGAAVICLLIDEGGQARDVEWKLEVGAPHPRHRRRALRPRAPATCSSTPSTFPLSTGDEDLRGDAHRHDRGHPADQGRAPRRVHDARRCPTSASASTRRPATSSTRVFLHECVQAGLDSAIVHAGKIVPAQPDPRGAAAGLPRPDLRPARSRRGLRPAARQLLEVFADVQAATGGREGGPHRLAGRAAPAPAASSTATATA